MNTTTSPLGLHSRVRPTLPAVPASYQLPLAGEAQRALARAWLLLGLAALVGSGLFSLLLVAARTPGLNSVLPGVDFFRTALVVHVDLSVLVWFSAIAAMLWSLNSSARGASWGWAAVGLCAAGSLLMSLAAFVGSGTPIMANYIPVIDSPLFHAGLVIFGAGAALQTLRSLFAAQRVGPAPGGGHALRFGLNASVVSAAVALLAIAASFVLVPRALDGKAYYEILFWGVGHALQFTWTLVMLVAWLWLADACGARIALSPRVVVLLFGLALAGVFVTPYAYLAHDVASIEHRALHTWAMRFGGGLAIFPVALAVAIGLLRLPALTPQARPLRAVLWSSMGLFASGGLIGLVIGGSNVTIPAHYHGCIVGITLALMGLVYHLLPQLGWRAPQGRLATAQPVLYAAGQWLHIVGLVWSGGYGVQRKVAGSEQVLRSAGEIAGMGLMGLGGLIAIVGGVLFVVVVLGAMRAPAMPRTVP